MKFYLNITYGDVEEWLLTSDQVCAVLGLEIVPDHSTLSRAYRKLTKTRVDEMQHHLLDKSGIEEEAIASDSTSFTLSQASSYYRSLAFILFSYFAAEQVRGKS